MSYFFNKTPILEPGIACSFLNFFLTQIKSYRGLTTYIEHRGINGCWLKPTMPSDIRYSKLIKILELKATYQTDDEFLGDWEKAGEYFLEFIRNPLSE